MIFSPNRSIDPHFEKAYNALYAGKGNLCRQEPSMDKKTRKIIARFQKNEITEYFVYRVLARLSKCENNRAIIKKISDDELRHYFIWRKYSKVKVKPDNFKLWFYVIVSALFGVTFGIKLMESGECDAQDAYAGLSHAVPEALCIKEEEHEHETELVRMIDEDRLKYMGSIVLGLNDALVEFTGALAGFTFALEKSGLIGMVGLIMGLSASFSMAASEYLSTKTESGDKNPLRASLYTGAAYIATVITLISPYFILQNCYISLLLMLVFAVLLIVIFTFYLSVVKEISFKERFLEMFAISMGVAGLSFAIGLIVKKVMHVEL